MRAVPQFSMADGVVPGGEIINLTNTAKPCGSGLARESAVSVNINVTVGPLSRASPLPHEVVGVSAI
jgi:hypothetical protein